MEERIYIYQTNCLAHILGQPRAGDAVLQRKSEHGYWQNVDYKIQRMNGS